MTENEITYLIRGAAVRVHKNLGPGLLESVYERILVYELLKSGIRVRQQVEIPVVYDNLKFDFSFRLDILVDEKVIIEVKSVESLAPVHFKQVLTYLKLTQLKIGLLINFNSASLDKHSMARLIV